MMVGTITRNGNLIPFALPAFRPMTQCEDSADKMPEDNGSLSPPAPPPTHNSTVRTEASPPAPTPSHRQWNSPRHTSFRHTPHTPHTPHTRIPRLRQESSTAGKLQHNHGRFLIESPTQSPTKWGAAVPLPIPPPISSTTHNTATLPQFVDRPIEPRVSPSPKRTKFRCIPWDQLRATVPLDGWNCTHPEFEPTSIWRLERTKWKSQSVSRSSCSSEFNDASDASGADACAAACSDIEYFEGLFA